MAAAPHAGTHTESRFDRKYQLKSADDAALHFRENATPHQAKSITYVRSTHANCRRWVIVFNGRAAVVLFLCSAALSSASASTRPSDLMAASTFGFWFGAHSDY